MRVLKSKIVEQTVLNFHHLQPRWSQATFKNSRGVAISQRCQCKKRLQIVAEAEESTAVTSSTPPDASLIGLGEVVDVEEVKGVRVYAGENNKPMIEYLLSWKDGAPPTWEPVENLADNLLRDFEDKWWKSCREGDEEAIKEMVENSPNVLPFCVDSNERSALHFCAALGKAESCARLCKLGAEVDLQDKDGYTPLHMAVGYSLIGTVKVLLDAGASPEIPDSQGRNVVQLVDSIRDSMPFNPQLAQKRIALEEVSALLTGNLFEEVVPRRILEERPLENGSKEYLIQWYDGEEDSWVKEMDISKEVLEDYQRGYEYGTAKELLKMKKRGDERLYLVKWADESENTWEFEDDISPVLVKAFEMNKTGKALEKLLADPSQWNFGDGESTKKRRRRRRQRKRLSPSEAASNPVDSAENSEQVPNLKNSSRELAQLDQAISTNNGNGIGNGDREQSKSIQSSSQQTGVNGNGTSSERVQNSNIPHQTEPQDRSSKESSNVKEDANSSSTDDLVPKEEKQVQMTR